MIRPTAVAAVSALLLALPAIAAESRRFQPKPCLDCHKELASKVDPMKSKHPGVATGSCEDCHMRHGIVPKLILKKDGDALCLSCHTKESLGLDKANVHGAVKTGACVQCHDPHASDARHLLKAEGAEACYACHDRKAYEKPVVHAPVRDGGCAACHAPHASDHAGLLPKTAGELCASCHDPSKAAFRSAHSGYPVEKVSCSKCHDPHAA